MSFIPTYVQSQEGDWFESPLILGAGDGRYWWMGWDADEGVILVVARNSPHNIYNILKALKSMSWTLKKKDMKSRRVLFPPQEGVGVLKRGQVFTLRQESGAPPGVLLVGKKLGQKMPEGEGVAYGR